MLKEARKKNIVLALIVLALMLFSFPLTLNEAFANDDGSYKSERLERGGDPLKGIEIKAPQEGTDAPTVELPDVHIDQARDFVEKKGFDVVKLLQSFAQPFSIGLFIFGAFLTLLGAFGRSSGVLKGIIVMALAVLVYAAVIAAPELVDFGNSWLHE